MIKHIYRESSFNTEKVLLYLEDIKTVILSFKMNICYSAAHQVTNDYIIHYQDIKLKQITL